MRDIITSIIVTASGIFVFMSATPLAKSSAGLSDNPALFPQAISFVLVVLGLILLARSVKNKSMVKLRFRKISLLKVSSLFLILIAYLVAMSHLGYIISTILFLYLMMAFLGCRKAKACVFSFLITLSLYMVFSLLFQVPLPQGMI